MHWGELLHRCGRRRRVHVRRNSYEIPRREARLSAKPGQAWYGMVLWSTEIRGASRRLQHSRLPLRRHLASLRSTFTGTLVPARTESRARNRSFEFLTRLPFTSTMMSPRTTRSLSSTVVGCRPPWRHRGRDGFDDEDARHAEAGGHVVGGDVDAEADFFPRGRCGSVAGRRGRSCPPGPRTRSPRCPTGAVDGGVHGDQATGAVEQRSPRVAGVDGRVSSGSRPEWDAG